MASWNGGDDQREDDDFTHPPRSPKYNIPAVPDNIPPDTEENVQRETEGILKNFMYQTYRQNQIRQPYDASPRIQEFVDMALEPVNNTGQIGRQLARIGDEINYRYGDEFDGMIRNLRVNKNNMYEVFSNVARKLISNGLNWGRVIALMCFAFRMAMYVLRDRLLEIPDFLRQIISIVSRFFLREKISKWIADHGGWIAALRFDTSASNLSLAFLTLTALTSIAAVIYYKTFA